MNITLALAASLLFACATPVSKVLLSNFGAFAIAGGAYFSSAVAIAVFRVFLKKEEAPLKKSDLPKLAVIILSGGVLAPVFLLKGLQWANASSVSVILNLEIFFTTLIAIFFFKEKGGSRFWISFFLVFMAALSITFKETFNAAWPGIVFGCLASFMWAIDNNFTASLSFKDPYSIAMVKGFFAGGVNILAAFFYEKNYPQDIAPYFYVFLMGALSYGASLLLLIYSMRNYGAARSVVVFGSYPIMSFLLSIFFLKEPFSYLDVWAFAFMGLSFYLIAKETHFHEHEHYPLNHEHKHSHDDEHHSHTHEGTNSQKEHSHRHEHGKMKHSHNHGFDAHHSHH